MAKPSIVLTALGSVVSLLCLGSLCAQSQDWSSRGRGNSHNPVVATNDIPVDFELPPNRVEDKVLKHPSIQNAKWFAEIGMSLGSEPAISNGLVWIGGSNAKPRDPKIIGDAGVLFCFRESDGKFLYQYVSPRRKEGRSVDWPRYGIASTPYIENDRIYFCTNRCETVCLDIRPLIEGTGLPTEVWKVDMLEKFNVVPGVAHIGSRHLHCSPVIWRDYIYVNTTHTVRPFSAKSPVANDSKAPPSLICFNKKNGTVKWTDNTPGNSTLGPQWGNPTVVQAGGRNQIIIGQGDGWVRSFDCLSGELIWKFDINEKATRIKYREKHGWQAAYLGQVISEPVFKNGRLFLARGYEYEFGRCTGRLCCIDPAKTGDLSSELLSANDEVSVNPNSGLIWEFKGSPSGPEGADADEENPNVMHSSSGSVAVHNGFVIASDWAGSIHCLDEKSGKRHWSYETLSRIYGSPLIMGDAVLVADEDGTVSRIKLASKMDKSEIGTNYTGFFIQTSPIYANGTFYFTAYSRILAIPARDTTEKFKKKK